MKKSIIAFAALVALLATNEVEAKDNKAIFDDDQLKKINDGLDAANNKVAEAEQAKKQAETAKAEAESKLATANSEKATLQARITELEAIVNKLPKQDPPAGASDTNTNNGEESFEDWYNKQPHVQNARRELGL